MNLVRDLGAIFEQGRRGTDYRAAELELQAGVYRHNLSLIKELPFRNLRRIWLLTHEKLRLMRLERELRDLQRLASRFREAEQELHERNYWPAISLLQDWIEQELKKLRQFGFKHCRVGYAGVLLQDCLDGLIQLTRS